MMHHGDISAKADLNDLANLPHVYALGAVENLKGEVLILDGQPFITSVENGTATLDSSFEKKATLLVWAQVENWVDVPVPSGVRSFEQFEDFIKKAANDKGLDSNTPFPFMLEGTGKSIDWHIINWKDGDTEHSHEKHINSGLHGTLENIPLDIFGFYSSHHRSIFTHHTTNIHAHFKRDKAPFAGHADDLELGEGMILKLPITEF